jgi:hypothetical protein
MSRSGVKSLGGLLAFVIIASLILAQASFSGHKSHYYQLANLLPDSRP